MLDYYGLYFGIERRIGETDEQLRMRIRIGSGTEDLPTPEAIYNYFKIALGISDMILCPVWPAGLYFVLGPGMSEPDIDEVITIAAASGVDFGEGTFLCLEDGEEYGLLILEDNENPIVSDSVPLTFDYFYFVDENNDYLLFDEETPILGYESI